MSTKECPWDKYLWKGEEWKQEWAVEEIKLWCSSMIAMSDPTGISAAMVALQSCPFYWWISSGLYTPKSILVSEPPRERMWTSARQLWVVEVIPDVTDNWRLSTDSTPNSWGSKCFTGWHTILSIIAMHYARALKHKNSHNSYPWKGQSLLRQIVLDTHTNSIVICLGLMVFKALLQTFYIHSLNSNKAPMWVALLISPFNRRGKRINGKMICSGSKG